MNNLGIINKKNVAFILIDIQDKFIPVIDKIDQVIKNANILIDVSKILNIPLIVTEQYPRGLGKTSNKLRLPNNIKPIDKLSFSCFGSDKFVKQLKKDNIKSIVIFGIESHVCILNTALDAKNAGIDVHVVVDAVSSRTSENKHNAIERMKQSNIFIVSTEMIIFQLMKKSGTKEFKLISKLIK